MIIIHSKKIISMTIHIEADLNADICIRMIDIHIKPWI